MCFVFPKFEAMKFIQSYEINRLKWDKLVENYGLCYQLSWYLDATAKNWCVLVNDEYTKGIALAFNKAFGRKVLYPPIYSRTTQFISCSDKDIEIAYGLILKEFPIGQLQLNKKIVCTDELPTERVYQKLITTSYNTQAKRMLSKANKNKLVIKDLKWKDGFYLIEQELAPKVKSIQGDNLVRLYKLLENLESNGCLQSTGIYLDDCCEGAMYYVRDGKRILYLKGAATEKVKKLGGMYLAMEHQINSCLASGFEFDFGGSSIQGIQRFFKAFGGEDQTYYQYAWDNSPIWFKLIRNIRKSLK